MKPIRTWVLIADAARARVFETRGQGTGLTVVPDLSLDAELAPSHTQGKSLLLPPCDVHRVTVCRLAGACGFKGCGRVHVEHLLRCDDRFCQGPSRGAQRRLVNVAAANA